MSRIFYDHLINLENLDQGIKEITETPDEKEELWTLIDEIIHHRILGCIFDKLPEERHHDFLCMFHECPYNDNIFSFINDFVEGNIEEIISAELGILEKELQDKLLGSE